MGVELGTGCIGVKEERTLGTRTAARLHLVGTAEEGGNPPMEARVNL